MKVILFYAALWSVWNILLKPVAHNKGVYDAQKAMLLDAFAGLNCEQRQHVVAYVRSMNPNKYKQ